MFPLFEVTAKNTLRHVIMPGNIRMLTWLVGSEPLNGKETFKVGYAVYSSTNSKDPIMQGYCLCTNREGLNTDKALLDLLGTMFYVNWNNCIFDFQYETYREYTEKQVDWLGSDETTPILNLLDFYEEEVYDESTPEERGYFWDKGKMVYLSSKSPVFKDVNVN